MPSNSVFRFNDHSYLTIAVFCRHKATKQPFIIIQIVTAFIYNHLFDTVLMGVKIHVYVFIEKYLEFFHEYPPNPFCIWNYVYR